MCTLGRYPGSACNPAGEFLVLLAAAVAVCFAQGKNSEELGTMSAFFATLGDQLALIAAQRALDACSAESGDSPSS